MDQTTFPHRAVTNGLLFLFLLGTDNAKAFSLVSPSTSSSSCLSSSLSSGLCTKDFNPSSSSSPYSPMSTAHFPSSSRRIHTTESDCAWCAKGFSSTALRAVTVSPDSTMPNQVTAKSVTKEIMNFYTLRPADPKELAAADAAFTKRMSDLTVRSNIDGMHVITILFQSARTRRLAKNVLPIRFMLDRLKAWDKQDWSERDISTFVYGVRSLEGLDPVEAELLLFGAKKISESTAELSSRAIGNALYGLQDITGDTKGAPELCSALADKIEKYQGDLNGQDIGIGMYGLQGMDAEKPEIKKLIRVLADKISKSVTELDAQALSNAMYGLQSMSSDYPEVLQLVSALSTKISESSPTLYAQAIGSALFGLQKMSSDSFEVRSLVSAIAEKVEISTVMLDAQAVGNGLFGLQRMKSNSAEVRALVQALANKMASLNVEMDSKGIGSALYGLHSMCSDVPQVRSLLKTLSDSIRKSRCLLNGQGIADSLYGLSGMTVDCPELRSLLSALASRIDERVGKLDSQEIGNALFGLQALSSEMAEVRVIAGKLAEKMKRSKAVFRSQHISRAMLGMQRISPDSPEIKSLLKQVSRRIAESDRTRMTGAAIADALFGLQGMTSDVEEVQELLGELAKKVATSGAEMTPGQMGRALFGLQGLSSSASIFQETVIGVDSDEVEFLLSALWDKAKVMKDQFSLSAIAMGMQGLTLLKDPIADNFRQFLYMQALRLGEVAEKVKNGEEVKDSVGIVKEVGLKKKNKAPLSIASDGRTFDLGYANIVPLDRSEWSSGNSVTPAPSPYVYEPLDVVAATRALRLNGMLMPNWLANEYAEIEKCHPTNPTVQQSRADKLIAQKYVMLHPNEKMVSNAILDGFRLDMDFPEIKLNIELDGPSHKYPARKRYDRERDEYLSVKKGYQVSRIELTGKSVEEIAAAIDKVVNDRKKKYGEILDRQAQLLYARDSEIQKLYSKKK